MSNTGTTSFSSNRKFNDYAHFRHGFNRSGDFSLKEADILERYGWALKGLTEGHTQPRTDEEHHFIAVIQGEQTPLTLTEKTWLKYLQLIGRRQYFSASAYSDSAVSAFIDDGWED